MSLSASEFYDASLRAQGRSLRLLDSIKVTDQDSIDGAWESEIASRVDDVLTGKVKTIPGDEVFSRISERRAARQVTQKA